MPWRWPHRQAGIITAALTALGAFLWIKTPFAYRQQISIMEQPGTSNTSFVYVSGFFKHDQQPTGPDKGFRAHTLPDFGLLDRSYGVSDEPDSTQWQRFEKHIRNLNAANPGKSQYRVLLVARHGEGVHNVKEREVGRHEWESKWAQLEGDGTTTWLDAPLTGKGQQQATDLSVFWKQALAVSKIPALQKHYTSPLTRCLQTVKLTFKDVPLPPEHPFRPVVKEALREIHGVHTCDKRSSRDSIQSHFPEFEIEHGFSEQDDLWKPDHRETLEERVPVMHHFLTELFRDTDATFVSLTTHSGAIRALHKAIGHPDVWVAAGAVVPIVVRAELGGVRDI